jgi:hypothetical protein
MILAGRSPRGNQRFKNFLVMFACGLVHETAHIVITWLSNGREDTPPSIGVAGYNNRGNNRGEAGRRLELELFGGTLEYYRDLNHSDRQVRTQRKSLTFNGTNLFD